MRNEKRMRGTPPFSLHIPLRKVVIPGLNVFLIPLHHQHELGISFFLFLSERRRGKEWEERNEKKEERTRLNQRQHHHHHSILIQWLSFLSEKVIPSFLSPFISNLHDLNSQIGFGLFLEKSHSLIHPHFLSLHHHNGIEERVLERESLNSLRILWMKRLPWRQDFPSLSSLSLSLSEDIKRKEKKENLSQCCYILNFTLHFLPSVSLLSLFSPEI